MDLTIRSETSEAVIQPGEAYTFELNVRDETGKPVPGVTLKIRLKGDADGSKVPSTAKSDRLGKAHLTVKTGSRPVRCELQAQARGSSWTGTICATEVQVAHNESFILNQTEEALLKLLFWDKCHVLVLREFGGGLGGSRVLQVQASDAGGANVTQVAKIGSRAVAMDEAKRYQRVKPYVDNAAQVYGFAGYSVYGAVVYSDANASSLLGKVQPFGDFFVEKEIEDVHQALFSVLDRGMRLLYRQFAVKPRTYRELVAKFMPEHLVVTLDGGRRPCGIRLGKAFADKGLKAIRCSPRELQQGTVSFKAGDLVALEGLRIGKVQEADLNLEDAGQVEYKVKVRFGGPPQDLGAEDVVSVVGKVVTDRKSRMGFAVRDCLKRQGAEASSLGYEIAGGVYPDLAKLFDQTLKEPSLFAWSTIHGDLHWDNVMIETPTNWRLIDYGLTGEGPVLFDFIKLEVSLRINLLAKLEGLTPGQILEFEQDLMDNPIGRLKEKEFAHPTLVKAAQAIRTIRRLARPYLVDGFISYWKFLFCYCLALAKYYPTEDRWSLTDRKALASCAIIGWQFFHALATALTVGRVLHWDQVTGSRPALKSQFVPMGSKLDPKAGVVALDVGNRCEPGVIDHHFSGSGFRCAASAVLTHPEYVTKHFAGVQPSEAIWVLHKDPDFDAVTSAYLAWHQLNLGYFPPGAAELARYGETVDAGTGFLETVSFPERTPYALFVLALHEAELIRLRTTEFERRDRFKLERGLKVLDYLCGLELNGIHAFHSNCVPHEHGFWGCDMQRDQQVFETADLPLGEQIEIKVRCKNQTEFVKGLVLTSPRSLFFKAWARTGEFPLLVVRWQQPEKPDHRFVVSVPEHKGAALQGLGKALEAAESLKRKLLKKERPTDNIRWPDADNNDPWYDGRGHNYTIVDSPHEGTVLTLDELKNMLTSGEWIK